MDCGYQSTKDDYSQEWTSHFGLEVQKAEVEGWTRSGEEWRDRNDWMWKTGLAGKTDMRVGRRK